MAAEDLRAASRHPVRIAAIDCNPPPGLDRSEFLRETQYEAELPDQLDRFDPELMPRLQAAFLRHAWVEAVERIEIRGEGSVHVQLRHRTPVLTIRLGKRARAIDGHGVLLPRAADLSGLPLYRGTVERAPGPTGTPFDDSSLLAAAKTAAFLRAQSDDIGLTAVEVSGRDVFLQTSSGPRFLWGQPPGQEKAGEATAVLKRDRLLAHLAQKPDPVKASLPVEFDLRPSDRTIIRSPSQDIRVGAR
jgi:hypothetical protein